MGIKEIRKKFQSENLRGRDRLRYIRVRGQRKLKWISKEYNWRKKSGFNWARKGDGGGAVIKLQF
jgi:hypothetical protein